MFFSYTLVEWMMFVHLICDANVSQPVLCRYVLCYSVLLFWWRI